MSTKYYLFALFWSFLNLSTNGSKTSNRPDFFNRAAVVTNSIDCTNIGLDILRNGGSVADSAIAALVCEGVTNPQSLGLGGGFILTIYIKSKKKAEVLNARECAPACATKDMFSKDCGDDMTSGGLTVAVPGELKGYWELHKRHGKMKWADLFAPTIKLLQRGIYVSEYLADVIASLAVEIICSPTLKAIFLNRETGQLYKKGELMMRPKLVETLCRVAEKGPDVLYNGALTDCFLQDIHDQGGIITKEDLKRYRPRWMKPLSVVIPDNFAVYTPPSPGAGCPLLLILDVGSRKLCNLEALTFWHRLIEMWKYAYGLKTQSTGPILSNKRLDDHIYNSTVTDYISSRIKDDKTSNKTKHYFGMYDHIHDSGTGHICILGPNGDAVSVTSTINLCFGALFASPSTGIILNNEMMDFAIPMHHPWKLNPNNYIVPLKQPTSSMCPTIIVDKHDGTVKMIVGASGGLKIISATSLVILKHLLHGINLNEAINDPRLHHQLKPMVVEYEDGFSKDIMNGLTQKGHVLKKLKLRHGGHKGGVIKMAINSAVNAISVNNGEIHAVGDCRRGGFADGY